ncbi:MAG: YlbF family regulator [Lachnospiraceae bacterium]
MVDIEKATDSFVETIKSTEVYKRYAYEKEKLERLPELKRKIDDYRKRMYEFQNSENSDQLFDQVDRLEEEGASFRANPLVNDFLAAELAFCRMMQEIYTKITAEVDFDMELTGGK